MTSILLSALTLNDAATLSQEEVDAWQHCPLQVSKSLSAATQNPSVHTPETVLAKLRHCFDHLAKGSSEPRSLLRYLFVSVGVGNINPLRCLHGLNATFQAMMAQSGTQEHARSRIIDAIIDVFWAVGSEAEVLLDLSSTEKQVETGNGASKGAAPSKAADFINRISELLAGMVDKAILPHRTVLERLDVDMLAAAGLIADKMAVSRQLTRVSTRMYYTQSKYNLLAEESEGYAKVLTELLSSNPSFSRVVSLSGFFSLDPNRIIDLIIDAAEASDSKASIIRILTRDMASGHSKEKLSQLLGFKFAQFHKTPTAEQGKEGTVEGDAAIAPSQTPASLYRLAAALIVEGAVDARMLWLHLSPAPAVSQRRAQQLQQVYREFADKYVPQSSSFAVEGAEGAFLQGPSPSAAAGSALHPANALGAAIEAESQKLAVIREVFRAGSWALGCQLLALLAEEIETGLPASVGYKLPIEAAKETGDLTTQQAADYILRPARSVSSGARVGWPSESAASVELNPTPPFAAPITSYFDVAACPGIASALGTLLRCALKSVHDQISNKARLRGVNRLESAGIATTTLPFHSYDTIVPCFADVTALMFDNLAPFLELVGPHLANDPIAVQQLAACIRHGLQTVPEQSTAFIQLIREHLFPLLSLSGCNVALANCIWEAVKHLSWPQRYELYTWMKDSGYDVHPLLSHARARALYLTRSAMKRVAKDTIKQAGRALSKASTANPLPVMDTVLGQLEIMNNLIPMAQDALRYSTPLTLDVITFLLVDRFTLKRERVQDDGMTPSSWLTALTQSAGHFYKRFYTQEMGGLLHHLIRKVVGAHYRAGGGDGSAHDDDDDELEDDVTCNSFMSAAAKARYKTLKAAEIAILELSILRELLAIMCAHELYTVDLNAEQLQACAGADSLRQQFVLHAFSVQPRPTNLSSHAAAVAAATEATQRWRQDAGSHAILRRSVYKLRDNLCNGFGGGHVAIPLLIMIAQLRQVAIFGAGEPRNATATTTPASGANSSGFDADVAVLESGNSINSANHAYASYGVSSATAGFAMGGVEGSKSTTYDFSSVLPAVPLRINCQRVDSVTTTLLQYNDFLRTHAPNAYLQWLTGKLQDAPEVSLFKLVQDYGVPLPVAWHILRPCVRTATYAPDVNQANISVQFPAGTTSIATTALSTATPASSIAEPGKMDDDASVAAPSVSSTQQVTAPHTLSIASPALSREIEKLLPPSSWQSISPALYSYFWAHSLSDIVVPIKQYEAAVTPLREAAAAFEKLPPARDWRESEDRKAARQRILDAMKRLTADRATQTAHTEAVRGAFASMRTVFLADISERSHTARVFVQQCLLPRVLLSPDDALYAAAFCVLCHDMDVPNLLMLFIYATCFKEVLGAVGSLTEAEAANIGVFMREVVLIVNGWLRDPVYYREKIEVKDCMARKITDASAKVTHSELGKASSAWYGKMSQVLLGALQSKEYMEVKCALVILKQLVQPPPDASAKISWPSSPAHISKLLEAIQPLREDSEERADIRVLATGVYGQLEQGMAKPQETRSENPMASPTAGTPTASSLPASARPAPAAPRSSSPLLPLQRGVNQPPSNRPEPPRPLLPLAPRGAPPALQQLPERQPSGAPIAGEKRRRDFADEPGAFSRPAPPPPGSGQMGGRPDDRRPHDRERDRRGPEPGRGDPRRGGGGDDRREDGRRGDGRDGRGDDRPHRDMPMQQQQPPRTDARASADDRARRAEPMARVGSGGGGAPAAGADEPRVRGRGSQGYRR